MAQGEPSAGGAQKPPFAVETPVLGPVKTVSSPAAAVALAEVKPMNAARMRIAHRRWRHDGVSAARLPCRGDRLRLAWKWRIMAGI